MAPVTRARAKATDKPPSPLKNILKAPARRAAKAKSTITTSATSSRAVAEPKRVTKRAPGKPAVKIVGAAAAQLTRQAPTTEKRATRTKRADVKTKLGDETMDTDQVMLDAPPSEQSMTAMSAMTAPSVRPMNAHSVHATPATSRSSKIPKPSPHASPIFHAQPTPRASNIESTPLRHKLSASRLPTTSLHKKSSSEALISHSPPKSSALSLQNILSQSPKKSLQLSQVLPRNPFKNLPSFSTTNSQAAAPSIAEPTGEDDVFQGAPTSGMKIFKSSSFLSPNKSSLSLPRKPPKKESYLAASPSRKNRSPKRSPAKSPPASPEKMHASMTSLSQVFPSIPSSSPMSSPDRSIFNVASSPRKSLADMAPPSIPHRTSSESPKKHSGDTLVSRSPSKMPRLSSSKSLLKSMDAGSGAAQFRIPASPNKSNLRSPTRQGSVPTSSTKKSVTWNSDIRKSPRVLLRTNNELGATVMAQWTSNGQHITHVLFKDGDDRTLEKVVASCGAVKCVNVGWAVDCERFSKHLPEEDYAIDLSRIPGMTPTPKSQHMFDATATASQPLSPLVGYAMPPPPSIPGTPMAPTIEFNKSKFSITTPAFQLAGSKSVGAKPFTPFNPFSQSHGYGQRAREDKENVVPDECSASPATPYFLHPQDLVQKTCPPKSNDRLFLLEDASTPFRQRLLLAKRKSLEFAPKISSPLRTSSSDAEIC